uniref:Protein kinase domain-containing protein n=1 Tax=Salix viminalis TaxID=40686 RepID=A0A6N2MSU6_SALVM
MIPAKTWSSPLLQNFSASACNISGNLPPFHSCKSVSVIELHTNNLAGSVPGSVSDCQALRKMDLAFNKFTGHIPRDLASLPCLSILDLSHNNFSGPIPTKFGASSSLVLLNVSFNDISGSIPSKDVYIDGRGSQGQWKMVSFSGLPRFTANDVLRSFSSTESMEAVPAESSSVCKAVLPTGITVSVKKIALETKRMKKATEFMTRLGVARHRNLIRLLGFCYNKQLAYVLYDYQPNGSLAEKISLKRDWMAKYRLVSGIASGLCFLHHDCYPAIPHGDLKLSELSSVMKEELCMDTYKFGEIVLEILTNGRLGNSGGSKQSKPKEVLLREIYSENQTGSADAMQEEIKLVFEVVLLCMRSNPSDRPSMEDALKLLSGVKSQVN